jgi:hypothetical protein
MEREKQRVRVSKWLRVYAVIKDTSTSTGVRGVSIVGVHDSIRRARKCKQKAGMAMMRKNMIRREPVTYDASRVESEEFRGDGLFSRLYIQSFTVNESLTDLTEGRL